MTDDQVPALDEGPISREEVRRVLGLVMLLDGRHNPGDATVTEWHRIARAARWTYDEAMDAVRAHYGRSTEYLMAGHISRQIAAQRENRASRSSWRRPSQARAASDDHRSGAMASIRRVFAEGRLRREAAEAEARRLAEAEEAGA